MFFSNCKSEELWYTPVFSKMALHGGGHLELNKMHKGDFWGLCGIRLGRCPCIIPEKISFLQFYSRFNPNALALLVIFVFESQYYIARAVSEIYLFSCLIRLCIIITYDLTSYAVKARPHPIDRGQSTKHLIYLSDNVIFSMLHHIQPILKHWSDQ